MALFNAYIIGLDGIYLILSYLFLVIYAIYVETFEPERLYKNGCT